MTTQSIIFYVGGCYGTFFEWIFTHIKNPNLAWPFNQDGSSHRFQGNFLHPPQKLFEHIESGRKHRFTRVHPGLFEKINQHEHVYTDSYDIILQKDIDLLKKHFDKIVILAYDYKSLLWHENNCLDKVFVDEHLFNKQFAQYGYTKDFCQPIMHRDPVIRFKHIINQELNSKLSPFTEKNLQGWNKNNIEDFEIWELRELLSFYWFTRNEGQIAAWQNITQTNSDLMHISISELKENFVDTILKATEYVGIKNVSIENISEIHHHWLPLQQHIDKDPLCARIVNSLCNNEYFDWSNCPLSIIDEACIQKQLYNNQIGIKCDKLDIFPTNTSDFLPLLEKI
jgi:hypothetical protein